MLRGMASRRREATRAAAAGLERLFDQLGPIGVGLIQLGLNLADGYGVEIKPSEFLKPLQAAPP